MSIHYLPKQKGKYCIRELVISRNLVYQSFWNEAENHLIVTDSDSENLTYTEIAHFHRQGKIDNCNVQLTCRACKVKNYVSSSINKNNVKNN